MLPDPEKKSTDGLFHKDQIDGLISGQVCLLFVCLFVCVFLIKVAHCSLSLLFALLRVEKGSDRHSTLHGRERSVFNQANIGTVSRATLGRLLKDGAERVWAFPSATMPSLAETETENASLIQVLTIFN